MCREGFVVFLNRVQNFLHILEKSGEMELLLARWFREASYVKRLP
jgi:hypothetical protein